MSNYRMSMVNETLNASNNDQKIAGCNYLNKQGYE